MSHTVLSIPDVILVDKTNILELKDQIIANIKSSNIIAYDSEFTGILPSQNNQESDAEIRYASNMLTAKQFGLLRIGITCMFKNDENIPSYTTYEFVIIPNNDYKITTNAFQFLISHHIDINKQYQTGILYYGTQYNCSMLRSNKVPEDAMPKESYCLLTIINEFLVHLEKSSIPFILHNGWLDLLFLYYHFYGPLQKSLVKCNTALHKIFPCIYDTKYMFQQLYNVPTYLEYCFLYTVYLNAPKAEEKEIECSAKRTKLEVEESFCKTYTQYGWCKKLDHCKESHNLYNYFIQNYHIPEEEQTYLSSLKDIYTNSQSAVHYHSAGFDSFCTGYIYQHMARTHSKEEIEKFSNLLCIPGKSAPLTIRESKYA